MSADNSGPSDDSGEDLDRQQVREPISSQIAPLVSRLLKELGEDPEREGLLKTPERVARAWSFLTQGYKSDLRELVRGAVTDRKYDEVVVVKNIQFFSTCEHYLLPFFGIAHVAYLPSGRMIDMTRIPLIVNMFARRLQLQERLTQQIAESLQEVLKPQGVAVIMEACHLCTIMRGVKKQDSRMLTSEMLGAFKTNPKTRREFLALIAV